MSAYGLGTRVTMNVNHIATGCPLIVMAGGKRRAFDIGAALASAHLGLDSSARGAATRRRRNGHLCWRPVTRAKLLVAERLGRAHR